MPAPDVGEGGVEDLLCPSAPCEPGALLLGLLGADGQVAYLRPAPEIDEGFVARARAGRAPEKRFRFAQPCRQSGCQHWGEGRCGVADAALARDAGDDEGALPACAIRPRCRWFAQSGAGACRNCATVVTNVTDSLGWPLPQT
ncbi:MAG TPA: hypothetical protein VMT37_01930 [Solirubrobacterales bacterium]|nr:hypothetical protein [Solirubrobacterales bacterium]